MISIDEAIARIQENIPALAEQEFPLEEAAGKYLAADVFSPEPSPRYTNSAMDGYAVCWEDVKGAGVDFPVSLTVTGESRAGIPFSGTVLNGQAVRISTGAMLPKDTDTVVRVEDTREEGDTVAVLSVRKKGQDIRYLGEEFAAGALLLRRGTVIADYQVRDSNMIRVQITWRHHGGYGIMNAEKQGSHMLTSLADADGYIILEPEQTLQAGERIDVYRYDFRREPV